MSHRSAELPASEPFELEEVHGEIVGPYRPLDLAGEARRLSDPAAAEETIHWGRNYLFRTHLDTADGRVDVVVKQFRNQGLRQRLQRRWRGSKAARSYHTARAFQAAGVATAEAVMLIESKRPGGPSFFVSRYLEDVTEARYLLRAANLGREAESFPEVDMAKFLAALGQALGRMHDAGFFHRDLSIGNVLLPTGRTPKVLVTCRSSISIAHGATGGWVSAEGPATCAGWRFSARSTKSASWRPIGVTAGPRATGWSSTSYITTDSSRASRARRRSAHGPAGLGMAAPSASPRTHPSGVSRRIFARQDRLGLPL